MGRYVDMAWLGLAGTTHLYPCTPPGSPGGSDKTGFPDQGQIDSWVPEEEWWVWDWDWEEGPIYQRTPQGPPEPWKYVVCNDTDYFIRKKLFWWRFSVSVDFICIKWVRIWLRSRTVVSLLLISLIVSNWLKLANVSNKIFVADEIAAWQGNWL